MSLITWWYVGPWVLDAVQWQGDTIVLARSPATGVLQCGWGLTPPAALPMATLQAAAAEGAPISLPVTGALTALTLGLGLDPMDLLAALLEHGAVEPDAVAALAPLAIVPWTEYRLGLPRDLASVLQESHLRESQDGITSSSLPLSGAAASVPFLLADDAALCPGGPDLPR